MYTNYDDEKDNEDYYSDDDKKRIDKEKLKRIAFFVLVFVILVILIVLLVKGCTKRVKENVNDTETAIEDQAQPTVVLSRNNISLDVSESFQLDVDVLLAATKDPVVSWRSDDSSIASVNDSGYVTAIHEGVTKIVAIYNQKGRLYQDECQVNVTSSVVKPEKIDLGQEKISMKKGDSILLQVKVTPVDAKIDKFIFESENSNIVTVNEKGYITASNVGTTTITVKTEDNTLSDKVTITVSEKTPTTIEPTNIVLYGLDSGLLVGSSTTLRYDIQPNNATNRSVTWKSSDPSIATVNNSGFVTGVKAGKCTIQVTTSNNISKSVEITVESNVVAVTGIRILDGISLTMPQNGTKRISYSITPSNATNKNVTYTSSNSNIAYVDSNGIISGNGVGNAVITVTTEDGKKSANIYVTVTGNGTSTITPSVPDNSGNGSSSSSGNSNNGQSSSSSSDNTSNSNNSCNAYDMITIGHNETGKAIISTISFENAKANPFTDITTTPTINVKKLSSCLKYANYYVYYGTDENNIASKAVKNGTVKKVGDTISLENGNGYYKVLINGVTNNGVTLSKIYYAYVNKASNVSGNYFNVTPNSLKNSGVFKITKLNSDVTRIYYCIRVNATNCTPNSSQAGLVNGVYYGYVLASYKNVGDTMSKEMKYRNTGNPTLNYGSKICFKAYTDKLVGSTICRTITN